MSRPLTAQQMDLFAQDLERARPNRITEADIADIPQAVSFATTPWNVALGVRFRMKDGSEANVLLNPVLARELAAHVLTKGQEAGWLTAEGDITLPPPAKMDS